MQQPTGSAVWLRLSTRQLQQPERTLDPAAVIAGAHWIVEPGPGAPRSRSPIRARSPPRPKPPSRTYARTVPEAGLLAITSPDRLHHGWLEAARTPPHRRVGDIAHRAPARSAPPPAPPSSRSWTVTPAAHSWLGAVRGQRVVPLGPDRFGQSGDLPDLYREYGMDVETILDACAQALLT